MTSTTDIGTTTTPAEMGRDDWDGLLGRIVTLHVEDSLGCMSLYSGTLATIREGVGQVVLEDVTRTRLTGCAAGEVHKITRRLIPICKIWLVVWLHF